MLDLMEHPQAIRNVLVAGHLHHGKTSLLDMLVLETHQLTWDADEPVRYQINRLMKARIKSLIY
jgi:U5 small nuclear ribonucleoprotein component